MVIIHAGKLDIPTLFGDLSCTLDHVHGKLYLESVKELFETEFLLAGFIIDDSQELFAVLFAYIHAVYLSLEPHEIDSMREALLKIFGFKAARPYLFFECIDRSGQNAFYTCLIIFVPLAVAQDIIILGKCRQSRLFFEVFPRFGVRVMPAYSLFLQLQAVILQRTVIDISELHRSNLVFGLFFKAKAVADKMGKRAGCVFFKPRYASGQHFAVKLPCILRSDAFGQPL